jgi:hypothetical protein
LLEKELYQSSLIDGPDGHHVVDRVGKCTASLLIRVVGRADSIAYQGGKSG